MAEVTGTVGTVDGPEESLFGDVTSVAADAEGRIYVADRLGSSIRAFGAEGSFLGWVGREGDGPGEFQWPNDIFVAPDSTLYIRDANRITRLAASNGSALPDSVMETWPLPGYANLDSRRGRLAGGTYFYPQYSFRRDEPPRFFYLKFGPEGFQGDTLHVPQMENMGANQSAFYRTGPGGGRMVDGLNAAPFSPRATWDVTSHGTLLASEGGEYLLQEFAEEDGRLRTISGPDRSRRAIPEGERRDSLQALTARIDSLPVPLEEVVNVAPEVLRGEVPDTLPSVLSVHWGEGERIWVQRWPPEGQGDKRVFDVLSYDGSYVATVVIPVPLLNEPPPFFGATSMVGVVQDSDTDIHTVVVGRFELPPG